MILYKQFLRFFLKQYAAIHTLQSVQPDGTMHPNHMKYKTAWARRCDRDLEKLKIKLNVPG